jgi:hypothetical protein
MAIRLKLGLIVVFIFLALATIFSSQIQALSGNWVEVKNLQAGDWLQTEDGWEEIESIEYIQQPVTVYNMSVSEPNTFFANGILAHNKPTPTPTPTPCIPGAVGPGTWACLAPDLAWANWPDASPISAHSFVVYLDDKKDGISPIIFCEPPYLSCQCAVYPSAQYPDDFCTVVLKNDLPVTHAIVPDDNYDVWVRPINGCGMGGDFKVISNAFCAAPTPTNPPITNTPTPTPTPTPTTAPPATCYGDWGDLAVETNSDFNSVCSAESGPAEAHVSWLYGKDSESSDNGGSGEGSGLNQDDGLWRNNISIEGQYFTRGNTYTINIHCPHDSPLQTIDVAVWVDWDGNRGEGPVLVATKTNIDDYCGTANSFSLTIPVDAGDLNEKAYVRARTVYSTNPNDFSATDHSRTDMPINGLYYFPEGEIEDYTININGFPLSPTPTPTSTPTQTPTLTPTLTLTPTPTPTPTLTSLHVSGHVFNATGVLMCSTADFDTLIGASTTLTLTCGGTYTSSITTEDPFGANTTAFSFNDINISGDTVCTMDETLPSGWYRHLPFGCSAPKQFTLSIGTSKDDWNLGLTQTVDPWWQTQLGDVWANNGDILSNIPDTCVSDATCDEFISLEHDFDYSSSITTVNGILVTALDSASAEIDPGSGGYGQAADWLAQGAGEFQNNNNLPDYAYWEAKLASLTPTGYAGGTTIDLTSMAIGLSYYKLTGDYDINGVLGKNRQVIILIDGSLTVGANQKVTVSDTDHDRFLMMVTNSDITFVPCKNGNEIEGIYIADRKVTIGGTSCPGGTLPINGTVVGLGGVEITRTLIDPADNATLPVVSFNYRSDFLVSAPDALRTYQYSWQEVNSEISDFD